MTLMQRIEMLSAAQQKRYTEYRERGMSVKDALQVARYPQTASRARYPLLKQAFQQILYDSYGTESNRMRINMQHALPRCWVERVAIAEQALARVHGKRVDAVMPDPPYEDIRRNESAFAWVACPVNDSDKLILLAAGCTKEEVKATCDVLCAFFDGPLFEIFVTRVSHAARH